MKRTRTVIEPKKNLSLRFSELWQYRELFYFFTWRDIKVKYKQTVLGIIWALIQPLALMTLFTLVFARHFSSQSPVMDYKVFVLSGLILWTLFYNATSHAAESIVQQSGIIKKIYFPRLIIIGSALLTAFFDFIIAFVLFLLVCLVIQQPIGWSALFFFPAAIFVVLLAAFGAGAWLAALNVKYRDFRYALPFILQFLFFASTIVYSLSDVKQLWVRQVLNLNPVNSAASLFRTALGAPLEANVAALGSGSALLLAVSGLLYFRKTEAYFADLA